MLGDFSTRMSLPSRVGNNKIVKFVGRVENVKQFLGLFNNKGNNNYKKEKEWNEKVGGL
jgi:hypothetical protein